MSRVAGGVEQVWGLRKVRPSRVIAFIIPAASDAGCKDTGKFPTFCLLTKRLVRKDLVGCHNALWRWYTFSKNILDLQESRSHGGGIVGVS